MGSGAQEGGGEAASTDNDLAKEVHRWPPKRPRGRDKEQWGHIAHGEEMSDCEGGEGLTKVAHRSSGCPIPGNVQGHNG